ncbi:hypothetical protein J2Z22_000160 [Paenibacillus forsythiae]|uniref:Uncharacterized protein n=1 Tax=Paenibacillus forsythiae TaxID=365616 RepID=A0ABU3H1F8_9BACL|nr:hypothetical protein [Paenibacillus forsythiae]MDT3424648.1 hypothetical protein [Paenibacillus forsythiae]
MPMTRSGRPGRSLSRAARSAASAERYGSGSTPPAASSGGVIPSTVYRRSPRAASSTSPLSRPRQYSALAARLPSRFGRLPRSRNETAELAAGPSAPAGAAALRERRRAVRTFAAGPIPRPAPRGVISSAARLCTLTR